MAFQLGLLSKLTHESREKVSFSEVKEEGRAFRPGGHGEKDT